MGALATHCPPTARTPEQCHLQCPSPSFCLRGKELCGRLSHSPEDPGGRSRLKGQGPKCHREGGERPITTPAPTLPSPRPVTPAWGFLGESSR